VTNYPFFGAVRCAVAPIWGNWRLSSVVFPRCLPWSVSAAKETPPKEPTPVNADLTRPETLKGFFLTAKVGGVCEGILNTIREL
jgi:hypothetical protein